MKDRNLWMKKEEKRTAPGLKRALKAVLGHKIVRLAGIAGVSLLFSASAAQTVLADDAGVWQPGGEWLLSGGNGRFLPDGLAADGRKMVPARSRRFDENGLGAGKWNLVLSARGRRDGDRLAEYRRKILFPERQRRDGGNDLHKG